MGFLFGIGCGPDFEVLDVAAHCRGVLHLRLDLLGGHLVEQLLALQNGLLVEVEVRFCGGVRVEGDRLSLVDRAKSRVVAFLYEVGVPVKGSVGRQVLGGVVGLRH